MRRLAHLLSLLVLGLLTVAAQATPITRYARFTGNYNYVVTGGSLRTNSNAVNQCSVGSTSSQALSGIGVGSTIVAAYLYWGGSGATIDSNVTLNGFTINASRTFTVTSGGNLFFGGFADVTSRVTGNGTLTFGDLTVDTSNTYCGVGNVMAGWSVVVVYGSAAEPLRAINIFDGLSDFFNSNLLLNPDGFRIPASGIDGKMTAVTWEGDDNLGGAAEFLAFNGNNIGLASYDSASIFSVGGAASTTYGADIDTYNVSSYLSPGQTSASTNYSAGGDRVFLAAQIISVTSEPQIDLSISKTHSGNFSVGTNATYTLQVANETGVQQVDYLTTVSDTLPAGLTFVSGTGTGWSCGAVGQVVTCTHAAPLASGSSFPAITLTVAVGNAAYPSVSNTATVSSAGSNDYTPGNNSATDVATVLGSNLITSTKNVVDQNGGEANVGDVLRYTINLINSSAVATSGASVTDNIPGNVTGFNVVSIPGGASNASTGTGTGTNGTGLLSINNINVPANGSVSIVFDVTIANGTSPGATIDNTATITNPAGTGATPSAPQVVVSPSQIAGSGTKQLYLWSNPGQSLSRTRPSGTHAAVTINGNNVSTTWVSTPALQKAVSLAAGNYNVTVLMARTGSNNTSRTVTISLSNSALGALGSASQTFGTMSTTTTAYNFTLNMSAATAPVGSTFTLTINNNSNNTSNRSISVTPYSGATYSRVDLNSLSVINVDSVQSYNATYAGGVVTSSFVRGTTAYIRAVVSDPFGSFDISSANITLRDPAATDVVTAAAMTQVNDSGAALKTYEYAYAIPANALAGVWTARITANEGAEGTISDLGVGTFTVTIPLPTLQVSKISQVISDPVNAATNPKRIPGSIVRYTITVTNTGPGTVDASTLVMTDAVPANTILCVAATCGGVPEFIDGSGSAASGLTFNYASNVTYSDQPAGSAPYSHAAAADAAGFDAAITGLRIAPTGAMLAAGAGNPTFTIRFLVKVN